MNWNDRDYTLTPKQPKTTGEALGHAGTSTKASHIMITEITTASLYAALQLASAMIRAGERAVFAPSHLAARFWERVGTSGGALEAVVDRVAVRCGIDISAYMIERAYGL
ncbi:hypothetical protein [Bradyrhizobium genosp. P]|uniref:hypothetical protein n=1 Tax=Bradyrhizobium genosp. P TaxID=83641 RepID=UPI003CF55241